MGATLALSIASCTNENNEFLGNNSSDDVTAIRISASDFKYLNQTRTDFIVDENGAKFVWAENDTVGIFPNVGDQLGFPMSEGAGASVATFTGGGWSLKESSKYYAYFPFSRTNFDASDRVNNIEVSYIGQSQDGNNSTKSLGAFDFMAAAETTSSNGSLNFNFEHLGCLLKINFNAPITASFSKFELISNDAVFTSEAKLDLQGNPISLETLATTRALAMDLKNISATEGETIVLYMMIPPTDLTNHNLYAALMDEAGEYHYFNIESKNFVAGSAYQINVNADTNTGLEASEPAFDAATKTYLITDGNELLWLAENNSALKPTGVNAKLMNDIDLKNFPWTPIQIFVSENVFVFDGNGYTISNLYIDGLNKKDMGLFGGGDISAIIKNLTIDGAKIENCNDRVGVIAGKMSGELINCHVKNSSVMSADNDPYVRKYGALVGLFSGWIVEDCSVSNVTVKAHSEIGGLFGCSNETTQNLNNCKVENTTLWATSPETDYSTDIYVGRKDVKINYSNCSYSNVTIK